MKIRKEVKIGLTAVVILFLLYWGIAFLKGTNIFTNQHQFYAKYENASDITISSPIFLKGLKVGTVSSVKIDKNYEKVVIGFLIKGKYKIPKNSVAVIVDKSLLGGKAIVIEYGDSPEFAVSGDTLASATEQDLSTVLNQITGSATGAIVSITKTFNKLDTLLSEQNIKHIGSTLENFDQASGEINALLRTQRLRLDKITANMEALTDELNQTMPDVRKSVSNIETLTDTLQYSLPEMVAKMNRILDAVNNQEGNAGKLVYDHEMYDNINQTLTAMEALLTDLKANPKRYVHFSLFGKKDKVSVDTKK